MMCLLCHERIRRRLYLEQWLSLKPVQLPILCEACQTALEEERYEEGFCYYCQKGKEPNHVCGDCQRWKSTMPHLPFRIRPSYHYSGAIEECLRQYKSRGDVRFSQVLANIVQQELAIYANWTLLPIPSSRQREQGRGFMPVAYLLSEAGLAYCPLLVVKDEQAIQVKQAFKTREERLKSPNPFGISKTQLGNRADWAKRKILLVDDVYTTGATMHHALTCLGKLGCAEIAGWALARAERQNSFWEKADQTGKISPQTEQGQEE